MGEQEAPEVKIVPTNTQSNTPDQSHFDVASMLVEKAKVAPELADRTLTIEAKDIESWTIPLSDKLHSLFGTEYTKDYLFVVLTEIKKQTMSGDNLFKGMAEKISKDGSVTFSFSEAVCNSIRTAAHERKAEQQLITADWKAYLVKEAVTQLAPAEKPKDPPAAIITPAPQEPVRATAATPVVAHASPEIKTAEGDIQKKMENECLKGFAKTLSAVLKPGQAVGGLIEEKIAGLEFKFDTEGIYMYKTASGECLINGLTVDEYIANDKKAPKFTEEDLKKNGITQKIPLSELGEGLGTVDAPKTAQLKSLSDKYKNIVIDEAYFAELETIEKNNPNAIPITSVVLPMKFNNKVSNYALVLLKTDSGYRAVKFFDASRISTLFSAISNPLLAEPAKTVLPNVEAHISSDIDGVVFPDIKSLGQKILGLSKFAA